MDGGLLHDGWQSQPAVLQVSCLWIWLVWTSGRLCDNWTLGTSINPAEFNPLKFIWKFLQRLHWRSSLAKNLRVALAFLAHDGHVYLWNLLSFRAIALWLFTVTFFAGALTLASIAAKCRCLIINEKKCAVHMFVFLFVQFNLTFCSVLPRIPICMCRVCHFILLCPAQQPPLLDHCLVTTNYVTRLKEKEKRKERERVFLFSFFSFSFFLFFFLACFLFSAS